MGLRSTILNMTKTLALTAVSLLAFSLGGCTAEPASTKIYTCVEYQSEPTEFTPYCADAGQIFSEIKWSDWGEATATGTAIATTNLCDPDCAAGNMIVGDVTLKLSKPQSHEGKMVFSQLVIAYDKPVAGRADPETLSLVLGPIK